MLIPHLAIRELQLHEALYDANEIYRFVEFPIDGVFSSVATFADGSTCEVGLTGREGFLPFEIVLNQQSALRPTWCQIPGRSARLPLAVYLRHIEQYDGLLHVGRNYMITRNFISEQLAACNALHTLSKRCARWLLMSRDRVGRDSFTLTHEYLATMLGVRRAGVTEVAGELQTIGAIYYSRGKLTIVDAEKLLTASCSCYSEILRASKRTLQFGDEDGIDTHGFRRRSMRRTYPADSENIA